MGEGQSHSLVRHRGENPVVKTRVWYHSTVALVRYDTRVRREQEASSQFFLSFFCYWGDGDFSEALALVTVSCTTQGECRRPVPDCMRIAVGEVRAHPGGSERVSLLFSTRMYVLVIVSCASWRPVVTSVTCHDC